MSAETYRERAPLLNGGDLAEVVLGDLLDPAFAEHLDGVYVYGSFVDPDRELDRDGDTSDLDIYVTVEPDTARELLPGLPAAEPGADGDGDPAGECEDKDEGEGGAREASTRFGATQHGLLCRLATQGALTVYGRDEPVGVALSDAPAPVVESLVRAERAVFHTSGFDPELLRFRPLDLTLGTPTAFERFVGEDPHLRVWPTDDGDREHEGG